MTPDSERALSRLLISWNDHQALRRRGDAAVVELYRSRVRLDDARTEMRRLAA